LQLLLAAGARGAAVVNRRERRAAIARGQDFDPPEGYVRMVKLMAMALRAWRARYPDQHPHFALPDRTVHAAASLDYLIDGVARNETARVLANGFCELALEVGGEPPTLFQLRAALEIAGIEWQVVPVEELGGEWKVISRGSDGEPS
jgi:hypothetical protein